MTTTRVSSVRGRVALAVLGSVSLLAASACGGSAANDAETNTGDSGSVTEAAGDAGDELDCDKEKAAEEGRVVFYSGDSPAQSQAMQEAFAEVVPGVEIVSQSGQGKNAREKVIAEQAAGNVIGDVVMAGGNSLATLDELGYLEKYRAPGTEHLYDGLLTEAGYDNPRDVNVYGFSVNTDLVPEDEKPTSYADLTDDRYQGLLAAQDPRGSGGGMYIFAAMYEEYGEEFLMELAEQDIFFGPSNSQLTTDIVRGEHGILITTHGSETIEAMDGGAPVTFVIPEEGTVLIPISMALIKGAPHPEAARCFIDWSLSKDGMELQSSLGEIPARKDVAAQNPLVDLSENPIFPLEYSATDTGLTDEYTKKWESIFFQ